MRTLRWIAAGILATVLLLMWERQFTGRPVIDDAAQSVRMGYNLAHHGVIAVDRVPPFEPTNYREPLPVWVHALAIRAIESVLGPAPLEGYESGVRLRYLKWENLFWLGLLSLAAFKAVRGLTGSYWLALFAVACLNVTFRPHAGASAVDDLMTEIPATAILVSASYVLSTAFAQRSAARYLAAGALFGALALIKAIMVYVFLGLVILVALLHLLTDRRMSAPMARGIGACILGFAVFVVPWVIRNDILLDTTQVTQRGGEGLYERALEDSMSRTEYEGAIYTWAPPSLQHWLGRWMHFTPRDLERGGRLQRLNDNPSSHLGVEDAEWEKLGRPDETVSFYSRARALRERIVMGLDAHGEPDQRSHADADALMERVSMAMIEAHPVRHVAMIGPFLWRGAARSLPILVMVLVVAGVRARGPLVLFSLPALLIILAYGVCITFFPRYGSPSYDVSILAAIVAAHELWRLARDRLGASHVPLPS